MHFQCVSSVRLRALPACTLQALVSQFQQFPHGGRHGRVKGLQVHDAMALALLHSQSDTAAILLKLHQTHCHTAHASLLRVHCAVFDHQIPDDTQGTRTQSHLSGKRVKSRGVDKRGRCSAKSGHLPGGIWISLLKRYRLTL